jgi:uncharacterized protein (TIGR03437 family)
VIATVRNYGNQLPATSLPPSLFEGIRDASEPVSGGEVVAIMGAYFGDTTSVGSYDASWPGGLTVNGYFLEVLVNGAAAPMIYAGQRLDDVPSIISGEIVAQLPYLLPSGSTIQLRQTSAGGEQCVGNLVSLQTAPVAGALYKNAAGIVNLYDGITYQLVNHVSSGEWVIFFGWGFGALTTPVSPGTPAPAEPNSLAATPRLILNGQQVTMYYAGAAPGLVGLYQFNVQLPAVTNGVQPVTLAINGQPVETFNLTVQ